MFQEQFIFKHMNEQIKTKSPSLKINILLNMFYQVLCVITPLITAPYVSRVLQAGGVGIHSYTSSLMSFFTLFAALGTASYGKRTIAELRDDKFAYSKAFWEIELITVFTTIICLVFWIVFSLHYAEYRPYMLVLSFTLLATLFDISWLYGGLEKFQYTVAVNSIFKVASIICIFLFVNTKDDVLTYTTIMSLSTLVGSVSMWLFLPKFIEKGHIEFNSLKNHFRATVIYFGPAIATSIYTVLDKTLIGLITVDTAENGYYEQATKMINIIKAVCFDAINGVMIARASFLFSQHDKEKLLEIRNTTYHLVSFLSVGACFGIIGVSNLFVPVFFGEGYAPVVFLLDILAVVVVIIGISSVANTIYYISGGNMKRATILLLVGSATNLIFNLILIPKYGSTGATVATLVAESVITILFINGTKGFIKWHNIASLYWKKIVSGLVMLLGIFIIGSLLPSASNFMLLVIEILTGGIIYIIMLLLLKDPSVLMALEFIRKRFRGGKINE